MGQRMAQNPLDGAMRLRMVFSKTPLNGGSGRVDTPTTSLVVWRFLGKTCVNVCN